MTTDQSTMRVTNIALDYDELPREITVIMSQAIADRINKETPVSVVPIAAGEPVVMPIETAAQIAKHYGSIPSDEVTHEIWDCLTGAVFNRFWDGGLDDYLAGQR